MKKNVYKPKEFAELLNVTVTTLQRWDREGVLKAYRNPKNRRFYTERQLQDFTGEKSDQTSGKNVIYARVSNKVQLDDLENQIAFLREYANASGIIIDEVISETGSGLNYRRKKWNALLDSVMNQEVSKIFIAFKDRFVRFGYDWFEELCKKHGTEIIIVHNEKTSPEKELVDDLISIIHVFSCRIYGLRKYIKKLKEDEDL
ncbi:MAG TPA: IS607 family transposase [Thermotogota bacterium]|nr:IS607 family transposase [Thermotogota bacterium]